VIKLRFKVDAEIHWKAQHYRQNWCMWAEVHLEARKSGKACHGKAQINGILDWW